MNKIEKILQGKETYDPEYPTISISDALEAMVEFGKLAFDASRKRSYNNGEIWGQKSGGYYTTYESYEDFLKSIEDVV